MREPIRILLDKPRTLRFDLNAMALLEERGGLEPEKMSTAKGIRFALWVGLRHEDPELTEEVVGAMVDMPRLREIVETIFRALGQDLPPEKPGEKPRPQKARKRA